MSPVPGLPELSAAETVDGIVAVSKRVDGFPLRREFLQLGTPGSVTPGPLHALVRAGDRRALVLYLLLVTKASAAPYDAALPSPVWARALGIALPTSNTARSTISKAWLRLERHQLIRRTRRARMADIHLLREDGSGEKYSSPGESDNNYFRVPLALWTEGPTAGERWFEALTLPELTTLLIARSLSDDFWLQAERGPDWYGISADTLQRGLRGLGERGLLRVDQSWKKAPLSPLGYTSEFRYTLEPPFGPHGFSAVTGVSTPSKRRRRSLS